jgi:hypothetical protein
MVYAASSQERDAQTLPAAFLVAGNAAPLKKMSPALFIALFLMLEATDMVAALVALHTVAVVAVP